VDLDGSFEGEGLSAVEDTEGDVPHVPLPKLARKGGTGKFANSHAAGWYKPVSLNGEVTT